MKRILKIITLSFFLVFYAQFFSACKRNIGGGGISVFNGSDGNVDTPTTPPGGNSNQDGGNAEPIGGDGDCIAQGQTETGQGLTGNTIFSGENTLRQLYSVNDPSSGVKQVAFTLRDKVLSVKKVGVLGCEQIASRDLGTEDISVLGSSDFNGDGWPDLYLQRRKNIAGQDCVSNVGNRERRPLRESWIDFVNGRTLEIHSKVSGVLADRCLSYLQVPVSYPQWGIRSVMPTPAGNEFALIVDQPEKTSAVPVTSQILKFQDGQFFIKGDRFLHPTHSLFEQYQKAAFLHIAPAGTIKRQQDDHVVAKGLVVDRPGTQRLVLFSLGRISQYDLNSKETINGQEYLKLVTDLATTPNQDTTLSGYHYGFTQLDPRSLRYLVKVGGAEAVSLFKDMILNRRVTDPSGAYERSVGVYDIAQNTFQQQFFGSTKINPALNYENRIVFPNNVIFLPAGAATSWIAYNIFSNGHWKARLAPILEFNQSNAGITLDDRFIWDIQDIDKDGEPEVFSSVVPTSRCNIETQCYFPSWETQVGRVQIASMTLSTIQTHSGIPNLLAYFQRGSSASTYSYRYSISTTVENGKFYLLFRGEDGRISKKEWVN